MPKNQTIIDDIEVEAKAKGVDIPVTEGLSNSDLADVLKKLKAIDEPAAKAPAPAAPDEPAAKAPAPAAPAPVVTAPKADKKPPFYMAPGKALTTLKGILADGDEVKAEYLIDKSEGLQSHVNSGLIIKS